MTRAVKAVLWDIDGTLLLTEDLHFRTIRDYCAVRGLELTEQDNRKILGKTMPEKWGYLRDTHGIPGSLDAFRRECFATYRRELGQCPVRPEPLAILRSAARAGLPQACVSNGDALTVRVNIERLGIGELLRFALCADDFARGKPAPDPYATACARLDLAPGSCLAVEDSLVGVRSAAAAGLRVCCWPADAADAPGILRQVRRELGTFPAERMIGSLEAFPLHLLGLALPDLEEDRADFRR